MKVWRYFRAPTYNPYHLSIRVWIFPILIVSEQKINQYVINNNKQLGRRAVAN